MVNNTNNDIDFNLIHALHETVNQFSAEIGTKITLIDGVLWPIGMNDPIDIVRVAKQLTSHPDSGFLKISVNKLAQDLQYYTECDYIFPRGLLGEEGYSIFFRGKNQQDIIDLMEHCPIDSYADYMNLAGFTIYHELFHSLDSLVHEGEEISKQHRKEFFCDFAACLKLKSEGIDIFLDVAKMRALTLLSNQTGLYAEQSEYNEKKIASVFCYANHHLYGAYKKWRHENPDVDMQALAINDIAEIARDVTYRHAFSAERLQRHIEHSKNVMPHKPSIKGDDLRLKRARHLLAVKKRPIGAWQDDYRRSMARPSTIKVSPLISFVNK